MRGVVLIPKSSLIRHHLEAFVTLVKFDLIAMAQIARTLWNNGRIAGKSRFHDVDFHRLTYGRTLRRTSSIRIQATCRVWRKVARTPAMAAKES